MSKDKTKAPDDAAAPSNAENVEDVFAALTAAPAETAEISTAERDVLRTMNNGAQQLAGAFDLLAAGAQGAPTAAADFYRTAAEAVRDLAQKSRNVSMNHAVMMAKANKV